MAESYVRPEVLVETAWVADHLEDPGVRIVESDEDFLLYETGHIPGAVKIDWFTQLQEPVRRDFLDKSGFEALMSQAGIADNTTVVFYGDKSNWFACYAFWIFQLFGHDLAKVMNGGRKKWVDEGRPLTKEVPRLTPTTYRAKEPDLAIRAFRDHAMAHIGQGPLVDVRSPKEYTGELIHMEGYAQEGAQRGGHIPTAVNIPWGMAVREADWTFKPADELRALYASKGITPDKDIIVYCRIGERSSHTWFVLTYLLGYPQVRNYDGSWTEWGNMVNVPIEKGSE
ncbi:MAG: sulfurtransferase [Candidatus Methylomirabilales bacterium]|nr:sulfurtransferase [candidate division NC10 bacterium]